MKPTLRDFAAQGPAVQGLIRTLEEGTSVHAYLISGPAGVGKRTLARLIAQHRLCTAPDSRSRPCGTCAACRQMEAGTHPDITTVIPGVRLDPQSSTSKSRQIVVDDIRALVDIAGRHTFEGGTRVFILEDCDRMNEAAANALLKTLEEPKEDLLFLLLTAKPEALLSTIISRCRTIRLHPWPDETVRAFLKSREDIPADRLEEAVHTAAGSFGRALAVAQDDAFWARRDRVMREFFDLNRLSDIYGISAGWKDQKEEAEELLDDLEDMLRTLLLVRLGCLKPEAAAQFPDAWQRFAHSADPERFAGLLETVREARRMRNNNVTLQAVLDRILLRLMEEKTRWQE